MLNVHLVAVTWASHEQELRRIRQSVFVNEQSIPEELEFDAEDPEANHVLALNGAGQALGCARLLKSGLIGRVAVLQEARGNGLGASLIETLVGAAQDQAMTRVVLHAQQAAVGFYQKLEFTRTGVEFMEAGIAHVTMERALPIVFDTTGITKSTIVRNNAIGRETTAQEPRASRLLEFAVEQSALEQLHNIISSARRTLRIYSPTLDHALFDNPAVVTLISNFARSAPGCQVEILIKDSSLIVSRGHLLVDLGRRLDEKMLIRRVPDTVKADAQSWLVADSCALWVQSEPNEYCGWSDTFNVVQAERFSTRYAQLWDRSATDPELRRLQL